MPAARQLHLAADRGDGDPSYGGWQPGPTPADLEDLPYKVEVWDANAAAPEHLVAIAVSPSHAFAAYYAAAREYFGREITITHKGQVLAHWRAHRT